MFGLDAEVVAPRVVSTFTTADLVPVKTLGEAMAQIARRVRGEVAEGAKYGGILEWTTGEGPLSGGHRRPHVHALWKGVDPAMCRAVETIARDVLLRLAGAHRQTAEEIRSAGAVIGYVAAHHLKPSQGPPLGFSGRRVWTSKGWWEGGAVETRARAKGIVAERRLVSRCERALDAALPEGEVPGDVWDELLAARVERERQRKPQLVKVREVQVVDHETGELQRRLVEVVGEVGER